MKKIVLLAFVLALLSTAIIIAFTLRKPVVSALIIYIRADGSVGGTDKIQRDRNIYTFTSNITAPMVVDRDNIVIDGAGYTLQGKVSGYYGIELRHRSNVTIKNMEIKSFPPSGIYLFESSNNIISGNKIARCWHGISLKGSSNNSIFGNKIINNYDNGVRILWSSNNSIFENDITNKDTGILIDHSSNYNSVSRNNITANDYSGIRMYESSHNRIFENNITANDDYGIQSFWGTSNNIISGNYISANNGYGINLYKSLNNSITENKIANNGYGIRLENSSSNSIYHNNFIDNAQQVYIKTSGYANFWDDGYPSGGNYWSDYEEKYPDATEIDESGIWNTPYVIDEDNQDNYPHQGTAIFGHVEIL